MTLSGLAAKIEGDQIVVTLPGTSYKAAYFKSPDEPRLIQVLAVAVDRAAELSSKDFEALAWETANAKARELGWF